ncbi:MAG: zinc-dependent metalloprotease [Gemmatimonadaceae bacterium]
MRRLLALTALCPALATAQLPTIAEFTRGMTVNDGFVSFYYRPSTARLYFQLEHFDQDFLYLRTLATGLGIPAAGVGTIGGDIDRGVAANEAIAHFSRHGAKVFLVARNTRFRAESPNAALRRSVEDAFSTSTLASLDVVAEDAGGAVLIDATPLVLMDVADVRAQLRVSEEGNFQLDHDRSAVYLEHTRAFPRNTETEASLTFTIDAPTDRMNAHAVDGRAITVREHQSFVALPDDGYTPRQFDPRVGFNPTEFYDFGKLYDARYLTRLASRHRLIKKDPTAAMSEPVKPIVYYLDRAVPEPYRAAFKTGAAWWNKAFEAAGFINAFRIEDMPDDMDPMDARFNVIVWIHRTQPASSYGNSFVDPRTGEIIRGFARMDSHRSVVDYNILAGALGANASGGAGDGDAADAMAAMDDETATWVATLDSAAADSFTMARRRQHIAHELGHTLGLAHNFAGHINGRASAMDYPAPLIKLTNGRIDVSDAYRVGIGAYDSLAIQWGYSQFAPGEERAGLASITTDMMRRGILFMTNPDEQIQNSHPDITTWVNGPDAVAELPRVMEVRRALLAQFDEKAIRPGEPMWLLNYRFNPVYLHHRYSLGATAKAIGGMEYRYGVRGDTMPVTQIVPAARQRRALELLLDAIQPDELAIPERILRLLAPRPYGYTEDEPRAFDSKAAPAFDQLGIAAMLARSVVRDILVPQRVARLAAFAQRDSTQPTPIDVVDRLIARTWGAPSPAHNVALKRVAERAVLDELISLAGNSEATVESRASAEWGLRRISTVLAGAPPASRDAAAHRALASADIERFLQRRDAGTPRSRPVASPPGQPIGQKSRP